MEWVELKDEKPKPGIDIEYIDSEGENGFAYLCSCENEWRCPISGGICIDVIKWRYNDHNNDEIKREDILIKILSKK